MRQLTLEGALFYGLIFLAILAVAALIDRALEVSHEIDERIERVLSLDEQLDGMFSGPTDFHKPFDWIGR